MASTHLSGTESSSIFKEADAEKCSSRGPITQGQDQQSDGKNDKLPEFCVEFGEDDPENPHQWSLWYQVYAVCVATYTAWAAILYSACYSSGIPGMMDELGVTSRVLAYLGLSLYLVGMAIGAIFLAPLSETFGRRPVYFLALPLFIAFIPVAAAANSFATVLLARAIGQVLT